MNFIGRVRPNRAQKELAGKFTRRIFSTLGTLGNDARALDNDFAVFGKLKFPDELGELKHTICKSALSSPPVNVAARLFPANSYSAFGIIADTV